MKFHDYEGNEYKWWGNWHEFLKKHQSPFAWRPISMIRVTQSHTGDCFNLLGASEHPLRIVPDPPKIGQMTTVDFRGFRFRGRFIKADQKYVVAVRDIWALPVD